MGGPYEQLYIYELEGILQGIPSGWREKGFLGCWYEAGYSFVFFSSANREEVEKEALRRGNIRVRCETIIPYQDWEAGTALKPFCVGPLCVSPPWISPDRAQALLVDPGVSFGSGFHGSTRACLELLVFLYGLATPKEVLDLGTGSGILALAAAKLGASRVLAVDCQPVAVETARANVSRNLLEDRVIVRHGDALEYLENPAQLVMANLHLELLLEMVSRPSLWRIPWCILAGVVGSQAGKLLSAIEKTPMKVAKSRAQGAWSGFLLEGNGMGTTHLKNS